MWTLLNTAEEGESALASVSDLGPNKPYVYTSPTISSYALTSTAVAKLGFPELLSVETSGDAYYYVIDVAAYTRDVTVEKAADDKTHIIYREGIGFRVGLVAWNIDVKMSVNLGSIAASSQLSGGQTSLRAHAFAGDVKKLGDVAKKVAKFGGTFNAKTLQELAGVVGDLATLVARSGHEIAPRKRVARSVLNPNVYCPSKVVASNSYAIEQLWHRTPRSGLENWLANHRFRDWRDHIISPTIVAAAYAAFGANDYKAPVTDEQNAAARKVQSIGR